MNIFNDDLNIAEEIYFVISNKSENSKKCEFELELKTSLIVAQNSECALVDITLPTSLRTSKFKTPRFIYLNIIFRPNSDYELYKKKPNILSDKPIDEFKAEPLQLKHQLSSEINSLIDLKREIDNIFEKMYVDVSSLYKTVFPEVILS